MDEHDGQRGLATCGRQGGRSLITQVNLQTGDRNKLRGGWAQRGLSADTG